MQIHLAPMLHTGDGTRISDAAIAVEDGRVSAVGERTALLASAVYRGSEIVEHDGAILPGFCDAHVHLLRSARDGSAVDCRPPAVRSIAGICAVIAERARQLPDGAWVDAVGYHELDLVERRHPTAAELEHAGAGHPVRLRHRSGHGAVVSHLGMRVLGIDEHTTDPVGGEIERDAGRAPTGLMTGRAVTLLRRGADPRALSQEVATLSQNWLTAGITTVCDAGPENSAAQLCTMTELIRSGSLGLRVVLMRGAADALGDGAPARPWSVPDDVRHRLFPGPVKFMLDQAGGEVHPEADAVVAAVSTLSRAGISCAIHAATLETIAVAAAAVEQAGPPVGGRGLRHRIEHASLLPDELLERLRRSGAAVVTHPLFIARHGDRYLLDESAHRPEWLYRCGSLLAAGIEVAVGSDAPVVGPSPLESMAAAMSRRTASGRVIGEAERVGFDDALSLHTARAAALCGVAGLGVLSRGAAADFVVVPTDPARLTADELAALSVTATYLGAELVGATVPAQEFVPC